MILKLFIFTQMIYKMLQDYCRIQFRKETETIDCIDDMIADMQNNKKLSSIVTGLFIRCRKLHISLVFITESYFQVPKDVRLNTTHFLIMKFQTSENLSKLHIIFHQILTLENLLQNHVLF